MRSKFPSCWRKILKRRLISLPAVGSRMDEKYYQKKHKKQGIMSKWIDFTIDERKAMIQAVSEEKQIDEAFAEKDGG